MQPDPAKGLYLEAWKEGLKGLATFRPNEVRDSVLSVESRTKQAQPYDLDVSDPDRRIAITEAPSRPSVLPAIGSIKLVEELTQTMAPHYRWRHEPLFCADKRWGGRHRCSRPNAPNSDPWVALWHHEAHWGNHL